MKPKITITTRIEAPIEKIWRYWTQPEHIKQWAHASDDWVAPSATNDVRVNGKFTTRMEAKDGSTGFDFGGVYTAVDLYKKIAYTMGDGRTVNITFAPEGGGYTVTETFEAENENSLEMQKVGWQAILDNFKKYVERV